jgi:hypothetical protein
MKTKCRAQGGREDRGRTGGCLDGSYPKGRLQVVRRRGRTNVEARQEVDLRAGASGRWEPWRSAGGFELVRHSG